MKEFISNLKKLNKYCKGQKCKIIMFFLFSLFMVALTVVMPLINGEKRELLLAMKMAALNLINLLHVQSLQ